MKKILSAMILILTIFSCSNEAFLDTPETIESNNAANQVEEFSVAADGQGESYKAQLDNVLSGNENLTVEVIYDEVSDEVNFNGNPADIERLLELALNKKESEAVDSRWFRKKKYRMKIAVSAARKDFHGNVTVENYWYADDYKTYNSFTSWCKLAAKMVSLTLKYGGASGSHHSGHRGKNGWYADAGLNVKVSTPQPTNIR